MSRFKPYLERARQLATPWYVLTIASIAGASVVAGVFDQGGSLWLGASVFALLLLVMGRDIQQRLANERSERLFGEYEGPVLWVVATWILMRIGGPYAGDVSVIGVALVAWLVVTHPRRIWSFPVGAALVLEAGMTLSGAQTPIALLIHLAAFFGASYALGRFADSEAFRSRLYELRMLREKALNEEWRARDFGLLTEQAPMLESLPDADGGHPTVGREMLSFIDQSLSLQLDQMRYSMGLTTAAVLWRTPQGLELKSHSSTRNDILCGPFPEGLGVPGSALRVQDEAISIAPVREKFGGLPYYEKPGGIGSLMALAIRPTLADGNDEAVGVLCIDRLSTDEWSNEDLEVMRRLTRKISLDVGCGKRLKELETRKRSYEVFCAALKELNSAQTVEQANAATVEAVNKVVSDADFTAITFFDGQIHRVVYAAGKDADQYSNIEFDTDGGLVGVALKKATEADSPRSKPPILPLRGEYRGKRPVFGHGVPLPSMRSMRIVPLLKPASEEVGHASEGMSGSRVQPVGALVVASTRQGAFDESNDTFKVGLNFLQLIAGELATKLELAHLHDQLDEINRRLKYIHWALLGGFGFIILCAIGIIKIGFVGEWWAY